MTLPESWWKLGMRDGCSGMAGPALTTREGETSQSGSSPRHERRFLGGGIGAIRMKA